MQFDFRADAAAAAEMTTAAPMDTTEAPFDVPLFCKTRGDYIEVLTHRADCHNLTSQYSALVDRYMTVSPPESDELAAQIKCVADLMAQCANATVNEAETETREQHKAVSKREAEPEPFFPPLLVLPAFGLASLFAFGQSAG